VSNQGPVFEEIHLGFVVVDNGEGSNADQDITTWLVGGPEANMQFMYNMPPTEA